MEINTAHGLNRGQECLKWARMFKPWAMDIFRIFNKTNVLQQDVAVCNA